jgi:carbonic anhydrase
LVEKGQQPDTMVIACCDSRVNPSIIARAEPGELFVLRNVANLAPPYDPDNCFQGTSAAIEYAVRDLNVGNIIVLGHSHCGGIRSLCDAQKGAESREFISGWMSIVEQARDDRLKGEERYRHVEREAIKVSLGNLLTFPWLRRRVEDGRVKLHGWWFDLEAGQLLAYGAGSGWKTVAGRSLASE